MNKEDEQDPKEGMGEFVPISIESYKMLVRRVFNLEASIGTAPDPRAGNKGSGFKRLVVQILERLVRIDQNQEKMLERASQAPPATDTEV